MQRANPAQTADTARRIGTPPKDLEQLHNESQRLLSLCQQVLAFAEQLELELGRAVAVEYTE